LILPPIGYQENQHEGTFDADLNVGFVEPLHLRILEGAVPLTPCETGSTIWVQKQAQKLAPTLWSRTVRDESVGATCWFMIWDP